MSPFISQGEKITILRPSKNHKGEYLYAIFFSDEDVESYKKGYDTESIVIWKGENDNIKGMYGYSYNVHDDGVYRLPDGSGIPPSDEFIEGEILDTLEDCVKSIAKFLVGMRKKELDENLMAIDYFFPSLNKL